MSIKELIPARNGHYWRIYDTIGSENKARVELGHIIRNNHPDEIKLIMEVSGNKIELRTDQIEDLIVFLSENYTAVKYCEQRYIPITNDYASTVEQITELLKEPKLVKELVDSGTLKHSLIMASFIQRKRQSLDTFCSMLNQQTKESDWQKWFKNNTWVFGTPYVRILDERQIDEEHEVDYLLKTVDGYTDIAEIKVPSSSLWKKDSHSNISPRTELTEAITQCINYIFRLELKTFDADKESKIDSKIMRPRCLLVIGRSNNWSREEHQALRLINSTLHGVEVTTYDWKP